MSIFAGKHKHTLLPLVAMGLASVSASSCNSSKETLNGLVTQAKNSQLAGGIQRSGGLSTSSIAPAAPICPSLEKSDVLVSWRANLERGVNSARGGYRVYYSQTPDFALASAPYANVPYDSGPVTSTTLSLTRSCTHYVKVVAYSSIGTSAPSNEITLQVP